MTIHFWNPFTWFLIVTNHSVVWYHLGYFSKELPCMIMNIIVVGACTIHFTTTSKPSSPRSTWLLEIGPRLFLTVYALSICEMVSSSTIRCTTMSSENTHSRTEWKGWVIVEIVFKDSVSNKCSKIESLLCTDNIMASSLFDKWKLLSRNCWSEHSDCISPSTIRIFSRWIDSGFIWSWNSYEIRVW